MDKDQEFMEHLLGTFKVEADEHLQRISSALIELEKAEAPDRRQAIIEAVFREVHSLKGAARSVKLTDIEAFCQAMEGLFAALKRSDITLSPELFDLLHHATDFLCPLLNCGEAELSAGQESIQRELVGWLEEAAANRNEGRGRNGETGKNGNGETEKGRNGETEKNRDGEALSPILRFADSPVQEASPVRDASPIPPFSDSPIHEASPVQITPPVMPETVRVSMAKLSSALLQTEEMLSAKLAAVQRVAQMRETRAAFHAWKKEWARILPELQKIKSPGDKAMSGDREITPAGASREMLKVLEFLDWNSNFITALEMRYATEVKTAKHDCRALAGTVDNLLGEMKKLLMFPFSSLLESFPKIARDLSRDYGRDVDLVVRGGEIEIDRRILEEMKDPLVHMVRNCIDHGIEKPEERRLKNKPERGTIAITISPKDGKVEVIVADDGAGIALDRVRSAVLKLGVVLQEKVAELADRELLPYVFQSGVSTSPIITELSGRGLGLAIVREKVEKLGGTVSFETVPDAGTSFRIVIPLTVATLRGVLIRLGELGFVIPAMHVERAVRVKPEEIKTIENRETVRLNGKAVSLARLADVLGLPRAKKGGGAPEFLQMIVLTAAGTSIAFLVDEVLDEREVLLKGLGRQLSRVRNVAGATVLGSGGLAPVLNVPDLLKSAVQAAAPFVRPGAAAEAEGATARKRSVMVAEDSITTRALLRNILEAAGYDVVTAVDGLDAMTRLKSAEFDIVVSDVDMPRMNGFDLTAKIRTDKKLGELPVVLVTALESREDRERGIDVGASAYIVKSGFDQSNLLEVIRRLV
jgi:two-component system, chemotaxis family, sensor kinase CheA